MIISTVSVSHNFNVDQIILKSKVLNSFLALHFLSLNWLLSFFIFPFVLSQPTSFYFLLLGLAHLLLFSLTPLLPFSLTHTFTLVHTHRHKHSKNFYAFLLTKWKIKKGFLDFGEVSLNILCHNVEFHHDTLLLIRGCSSFKKSYYGKIFQTMKYSFFKSYFEIDFF